MSGFTVQITVKNLIEAFKHYERAFGATIKWGQEVVNGDLVTHKTAEAIMSHDPEKGDLIHLEIDVMGKTLALAPMSCEIVKSNVMTLYLRFEDQESLGRAFKILRESGLGGDEVLSSAPWSEANAGVTDKYGVNWWLHI